MADKYTNKNAHILSIGTIRDMICNENPNVRAAALYTCEDRDVFIEIIQKGLEDKNWYVRAAALNACEGREVPIEFIQRGLKDRNLNVRVAALNACKSRDDIQIPLIRTIEPPDLVYKKCIGDVIVVASIPKDAQIRGPFGKRYRANKAIIKDIIGDICGKKIGISQYDNKTIYCIGDRIEIENFDYGDRECSAGFHFFCTLKEAKKY